jgi:hypothetical protein
MSRYEYTYNILDNIRQFAITTDTTIVSMILDANEEMHADIVALFDIDDIARDKYVDYLGDNPNRTFNKEEILSLNS